MIQINRPSYGWTNGQTYPRVEMQVASKIDGLMDRPSYGRTNGQSYPRVEMQVASKIDG